MQLLWPMQSNNLCGPAFCKMRYVLFLCSDTLVNYTIEPSRACLKQHSEKFKQKRQFMRNTLSDCKCMLLQLPHFSAGWCSLIVSSCTNQALYSWCRNCLFLFQLHTSYAMVRLYRRDDRVESLYCQNICIHICFILFKQYL